MKNSADPQRTKAEEDNTLRDLQNSSYPTKAEFNNCFIIHSKYLPVLEEVSPFRSLFFRSPKVTRSRTQVFSVYGSIICSRLHFWRHFDVIRSIICSELHFWRHKIGSIWQSFVSNLVNSSWLWGIMRVVLTGTYFEWIIIFNIVSWRPRQIASAHPYCERKFTRHVMHPAGAK